MCAAVQHERGPRRLKKFCLPAVSTGKSSMCSPIVSSSSSVLPIRPSPQSAAAPGRERPMDLRVASTKSPTSTMVEAARTALLRRSTMPLAASGALSPYDVRFGPTCILQLYSLASSYAKLVQVPGIHSIDIWYKTRNRTLTAES